MRGRHACPLFLSLSPPPTGAPTGATLSQRSWSGLIASSRLNPPFPSPLPYPMAETQRARLSLPQAGLIQQERRSWCLAYSRLEKGRAERDLPAELHSRQAGSCSKLPRPLTGTCRYGDQTVVTCAASLVLCCCW